ncbi:MAG: hypothetical protein NT027_04530 [Proteobacteria bacterium]|nr:hypothetical protein [Pseudomonadota bacterium]
MKNMKKSNLSILCTIATTLLVLVFETSGFGQSSEKDNSIMISSYLKTFEQQIPLLNDLDLYRKDLAVFFKKDPTEFKNVQLTLDNFVFTPLGVGAVGIYWVHTNSDSRRNFAVYFHSSGASAFLDTGLFQPECGANNLSLSTPLQHDIDGFGQLISIDKTTTLNECMESISPGESTRIVFDPAKNMTKVFEYTTRKEIAQRKKGKLVMKSILTTVFDAFPQIYLSQIPKGAIPLKSLLTRDELNPKTKKIELMYKIPGDDRIQVISVK